jgi:hypothetical protein
VTDGGPRVDARKGIEQFGRTRARLQCAVVTCWHCGFEVLLSLFVFAGASSVHALAAAVLLRVARLDALDRDS